MQKNNKGWSPQSIGAELRKGIYTEDEIRGAVGNINSPLLDLPLKNNLLMKAGVGSVTFERASTATYIDRYGVLRYAEENEPRFEKEGLLIEGASTNISLYSEDLTNSEYLIGRGTIADSGVPSINGNNSFRFRETTDDGPHYIRNDHIEASETALDEIWTFSVFIDITKITANRSIALRFEQAGIGMAYYDKASDTFTLDTGESCKMTKYGDYRRFELTTKIIDEDSKLYPTIRTSIGIDTSFPGDENEGFDLAHFQVEKLPFATSYIPTTDSAVTRTDDRCSVTFDDNFPGYNDSSVTVAVDSSILGINNSIDQYIFRVSGVEYINMIASIDGNKRHTNFYTSINYPYGDDVTKTERYCITRDMNASTNTMYIDGEIVGTAGTASISGTPTLIALGQANNDRFLFGHLRDFKIYDRALTPIEVNLL